MWGILVFIIIIALIMNSKKRKTKYKADGKNIRTISPSQICRNRI